MTNVFKHFTQCLSTHWFKGNSFILSGPEIKSHITQVSLTCVSVLTMIAFKNRCNVSALASADWLLQPDQVLWHCEDRHHDLWGDWVLRKRFSAGKEFWSSPSTPKLSNFKLRNKIHISVSGLDAAAMDGASGGRFLTQVPSPLLGSLQPSPGAAAAAISLMVLSSQRIRWGASKEKYRQSSAQATATASICIVSPIGSI